MGNSRETGRPICVVIAESGIVLREGIRLFLAQRSDVTVVGETGNGREAVELVLKLSPDVVVMDVHLHELNGVEATRAVKTAEPTVAVLAISTRSEQPFVSAILSAGADAHVFKESLVTDLMPAIEAVSVGRSRRQADPPGQ